MVVGLGVLLGEVLAEDIVAGGGESVAAHATVVFVLVGGLTEAGEAHDDVARADVGVVDDIAALHAAGDGGIDDDGADEVAHVGRLAAGGIDADAHLAQLTQEFVGAVDDGADDFAGDEHLVAPDGGRDEDVVHGTHAQQVVGVHDEGILCNAFPDGEVTCLAPVGIGQAALGAGSVGVHDVAVLGVAAEDVWDDFAEGLREDSLVDVSDGSVYVLLCGRDATRHVTLLAFHQNSTVGAFSAPASALKLPLTLKPKRLAKMLLGKLRTVTLYFCAASLKSRRDSAIRFSVPSS